MQKLNNYFEAKFPVLARKIKMFSTQVGWLGCWSTRGLRFRTLILPVIHCSWLLMSAPGAILITTFMRIILNFTWWYEFRYWSRCYLCVRDKFLDETELSYFLVPVTYEQQCSGFVVSCTLNTLVVQSTGYFVTCIIFEATFLRRYLRILKKFQK